MAQKTNRWIGKARRHVTLGQLDLAEGLCRKILKKKPDHPDALLELGKVLYFQKKFEDGGKQFQRVLEQHPNDCEARLLLYSCYKDGKNFDAMMDLVREFSGPASIPDEKLAAYLAYLEICDWPRASALQEEVLELARNDKISHFRLPNFLLTLNSVPGISPSLMHELHQMWGNNALAAVKGSPPFKPLSFKRHERLRIGYLSPDFNLHPVGKFIEAIIASHDRNRFEIYCYAYLLKSDARTDQIRRLSDHFIDITQLSFIDLARHIHADGIDILVDLGGHTALSRLQAMLFRPAPVQITYLGYPNTTGIPTVDFRITDRYAECDEGTRHVETPLYMPQSFLCLGGLPEMKRVDTTPAVDNGYITFGSLNNIRKINPDVIRVWSGILKRVDRARLIIKSPGCENDIIRSNILAEFRRHHIDEDRIQFATFSASYEEHARIYNRIDIALDSFPYNGTTTTCETLWMGVPVITLVGKHHAQRTSFSILKNIGFDATIACSEEEYIDRAVDLASRPEGLSVLRKCIPTLIKHSILCQPKEFTRQLEVLYMDACRRKGVDIFEVECAETALTMTDGVAVVVPDTLEKPTPQISGERENGNCDSLIGELPGGISIALPNDLNLMTPYVLQEQHDWFEDEIEFVRHLVQPDMYVIDIGANYGCYTLTMAKLIGKGGKLWAFEPASATAGFLKKSLKLNAIHNVRLLQSALSDHAGEAQLALESNAELNALVEDGTQGKHTETVQLQRLDDCMDKFGWNRIDFIKIDAEGEENHILDGGQRFLECCSPLIMFELKDGQHINEGLIQHFIDFGYSPYSLVPGLSLLAPFDIEQTLDPFQLNLFCCKNDRAKLLEQAGRLTRDIEDGDLEIPEGEHWRTHLKELPYAQSLFPIWNAHLENGKPLPGWPAYRKALNTYALSRQACSAKQRLHYLQSAFFGLVSLLEEHITLPRIFSLARITTELGQRGAALKILNDIINHFVKEPQFTPDEPFLAVSTYAEKIDPSGHLNNWCFAQVLAQRERLQAFSSYFTGQTSLPALKLIRQLGFEDDDMRRRYILIQKRFSLEEEGRCNKQQNKPELVDSTSGNVGEGKSPGTYSARTDLIRDQISSDPLRVFVAGASRTGSMWIYNITRALITASGKTPLPESVPVQEQPLIDKIYTLPSRNDEVFCIKTHTCLQPNLPHTKIIMTYRDVRDSMLSFMRFMKMTDFSQALKAAKNMMEITDFYFNQHRENILHIRYNDIVERPLHIVDGINRFLHLRVGQAQVQEINNHFAKKNIQKLITKLTDAAVQRDGCLDRKFQSEEFGVTQNTDKSYRILDKKTGFQTNHITSKQDGEWKDVFTEDEQRKLLDLTSGWLQKHGFSI